MMAILTSFIELLVGGIQGVATGIGEGLSALVQNIFMHKVGEAWELSMFGSVIAIFAGISLAIALSRWVVNFVTSIGARNR